MDPETPVGLMDVVYSLYIVYGILRGLFRGLSEELAGLVGTGIVFYGGWRFYRPVGLFIQEHTRLENEDSARVLAYVLMVFLFLASWKLVVFLIRKLMKWTFPDQIQAPGGAVLGGAKCALVLCVLLLAVRLLGHGFLDKHMIQDSWMGRTTQEVIPAMVHRWAPGWFPEDAFDPPSAEDAEHGPGNA